MLVTAGGTREAIDSVRYVGNRSSGRMGFALAEEAVAATQHKDVYILDTLAAAYAETGQFTNAVGVQKEALALIKDPGTRSDCEARLKLYEANSPYREPPH